MASSSSRRGTIFLSTYSQIIVPASIGGLASQHPRGLTIIQSWPSAGICALHMFFVKFFKYVNFGSTYSTRYNMAPKGGVVTAETTWQGAQFYAIETHNDEWNFPGHTPERAFDGVSRYGNF